MSENHDHHILELVTFKLLPGVTEDQFIAANETFSGWATRQPGFVSRHLSYNESEETYIDVDYWVSLAAAQAANDLATLRSAHRYSVYATWRV